MKPYPPLARTLALTFATLFLACPLATCSDLWVTFNGLTGPGQGKYIVLICGDEEYRSEEALPMLARILAVHHGFKTTVLFPIHPDSGEIDPNTQTNIPGLHLLDTADMMILFTRFRELPDDQMKYFANFVHSGKPILGIRTATHAFSYERNKQSPYAHYDWRSKIWPGGFGQQVLGETWIDHHGHHGTQSTRGILNPALQHHPVLRGVTNIWGPTDVYTVKNLPPNAQVLVHGQVVDGMKPSDPPLDGPKNNPMMPLVWLKSFTTDTGTNARIICSTMGGSNDLENEGYRRLLVNASYWALNLENQIPPNSNVDYVGSYNPTFFGFGKFKPGQKPADHSLTNTK